MSSLDNLKGGMIVAELELKLAEILRSVTSSAFPTKKNHSLILRLDFSADSKARNNIKLKYSIRTRQPDINRRAIKFVRSDSGRGNRLTEESPAKGRDAGSLVIGGAGSDGEDEEEVQLTFADGDEDEQ